MNQKLKDEICKDPSQKKQKTLSKNFQSIDSFSFCKFAASPRIKIALLLPFHCVGYKMMLLLPAES